MPKNTHKRKASGHAKSKSVKRKASGGRTSNPQIYIASGLCLVAFGLYLLLFTAHGNGISGFAMLAIIIGVVTAIIARFSGPDKKAV